MKENFRKYRNLLLILLVFTVNTNYAVTVGLCAMGMDHDDECCCLQEQAGTYPTTGTGSNSDVHIDGQGCCTEYTKEYSNRADFEFIKKLEKRELISFFTADIFSAQHNSMKSPFVNYTYKSISYPEEDIPIKHSSLLI